VHVGLTPKITGIDFLVVAEHKRPVGKRWIENLLALGAALGYGAEPEYDVLNRPDREGPADVVWLGSDTDGVPLFIFEVETQASAQVGHNAGKVFSQETSEFEKPLFHFHLIVEGGKDNSRVDVAMSNYGKFNYRIYGVKEGEATMALCDVLAEHRRVTDHLDVEALVSCLAPRCWPEVDMSEVWRKAEELGFKGAWMRAYAVAALAGEAGFLDRLLPLLDAGAPDDDIGYCTYLGERCGGALHAGLLAAHNPERGEEALAALKAWQAATGTMPRPGLDRDEDDLLSTLMPPIWALLALLLGEVEGAREWILEQLALMVDGAIPLHRTAHAASATWMLHIAAATPGAERFFERARTRLNADGGIAPALLAEPPAPAGRIDDYDAWWEELETDKEPVPEEAEFRARYGEATADTEAVVITLSYLLEEAPPPARSEIRGLLYASADGSPG
jgi:hypothetical protein